MQKNKDLPASAVHPIQDKFGQVILMTGFTKQEIVALEILKKIIVLEKYWDDPAFIKDMTEKSYQLAEIFCSHLENEGEKESGLIIN